MVSCKILLLAMLVGTALAAARPQNSDNYTCIRWCGETGSLYCCDRKCPIDTRPWGNCDPESRPQAFVPVSGPQECSSHSSCAGDALCCIDNCLRHKKCTNVPYPQ